MRRVDWRTVGLACFVAALLAGPAWGLAYFAAALAYRYPVALGAAVFAALAVYGYRWLREDRHPRPPR